MTVPCENDKNIDGHCAIQYNDFCVHEHFPTHRQPRHQGPLEFSTFSGAGTQIFVRKYNVGKWWLKLTYDVWLLSGWMA